MTLPTSGNLAGDLRLPSGRDRFPVAIIVHGGCWQASVTNGDEIRPLAEALPRDGIATWMIRYRRVDEAGGGWPGTFLDLAAAADSLRALARRYPSLDTTQVIVVGHSAGASLAAWLAVRPLLSEADSAVVAIRGTRPLRVRGVVALDGPLDLSATRPIARAACGAEVLDQLLGGTPETHAARWRAASPVPWLGPDRPELRQAVVPGQLDAILGTRQPAASLREYARLSGARVFAADPADHFSMLDPTQPAWQSTRDAVRYVLGRTP